MNESKSYINFFHNILFLLKIFISRDFRLYCLFIIILTTFSSLMPLINIELFKRLMNAIQLGQEFQIIIIFFAILILIQILQKLTSSLNSFLTGLFQLRLNNYVSELIMKHISLMKNEELFSSKTIDRLYFLRTTSTSKIGSIFSLSISIFSLLVTSIALFIYLLNWIPLYATLVILCSVPIAIVQLYFNKKNYELANKMNKHHREQFYLIFISTTPQYLKEITQYSAMNYLVKAHLETFNKIFKPTKSLSGKETVANVLSSLIGIMAISIAQFNTIALAFNGHLLIGTLMSILQALGMVFQKIQGLILNVGSFHSEILYVYNLKEFLNSNSKNKKFEKAEANQLTEPIILSAKNLSYCVNGVDIFKNIDFRFTAGSVIGIMGENGVGKSTLLEIIQGFKKETSGELYFNDVVSTSIPDDQRNKLCQTLRQTPSRYELSLGENIGISDTKKFQNQRKVDFINYINKIDQDSFIINHNFKKETLLGDWYRESYQLSGGQWQRIALYRLFYKNSPIYLIDEPTNNLDEDSLGLLENLIQSVSKDSLIIIVSHDGNFLSKTCTEVYNMHKNGFSQLLLA